MDYIRDDMVSTLRSHGEILERLSKQSELIYNALMGNIDSPEEPGVIKRVSDHDKFIKACQERKKEDSKRRIDYFEWAFKGLVGGAVTYCLYLIRSGKAQ